MLLGRVGVQVEPVDVRMIAAHDHDEPVASHRLVPDLGPGRDPGADLHIDAAVPQLVGVDGGLGEEPQAYAGRAFGDVGHQYRRECGGQRVVALKGEDPVQDGEVEIASGAQYVAGLTEEVADLLADGDRVRR